MAPAAASAPVRSVVPAKAMSVRKPRAEIIE
jgi:hypothetical protein